VAEFYLGVLCGNVVKKCTIEVDLHTLHAYISEYLQQKSGRVIKSM